MERVQTKKRKSKRIFYLDALRALAIISVITYHVSISLKWMAYSGISVPTLSWIMSDFFTNCFRVGVDVFLMLAGALSLGREWTIKEFLSKRLPRIIEPYVFWLILTMLVILFLHSQFPEIINAIPSFTVENIWDFIVDALSSKPPFYYSYWFFWMILGTYFIMPIFNKWLLHSDLKEAEYFLLIWLIPSLFTYTLNMKFPVKLSYFTSPIGMAILGYYLRHTKRKIFTNLYTPVILIVVAVLLQLQMGYLMSTPDDLFRIDRYSILMAIEAAGIFLLFRNLDEKHIFAGIPEIIKGLFRKIVASLAKYSYGIYLNHLCIFVLFYKTIKYYKVLGRYWQYFAVLFVLTLATSWIIMAVLNRVKYVNKVIGAK